MLSESAPPHKLSNRYFRFLRSWFDCANERVKRATIAFVKGVGILAGIGFLLSPVTTYPGILWFVGSIVVGLISVVALGNLDDEFVKKHGFWPKPLDWSRPSNDSTEDKPRDTRGE